MLQSLIKNFKFIKTWKTLPVFDWVQAADCFKSRDYKKAADFYARGIVRHKKHPALNCAMMDQSYCLFKSGDYAKAESVLRQVVRNIPRSREASLRLARLLAWSGDELEAIRVVKRLLAYHAGNVEILSELVFLLYRNSGPDLMIQEVHRLIKNIEVDGDQMEFKVALSLLEILDGDGRRGRLNLTTLAGRLDAPLEAHLFFGIELLKEGKIANARIHLRAALQKSPENPYILGRLAESYLVPGEWVNNDFAMQVAMSAVQHSFWLNPREMFVLSRSYVNLKQKSLALLTATRAKQVSTEKIGFNPSLHDIDQFLEDLAGGTVY